MDESGVRAAVKHYLDHSAAREEDVAHEIYLDDAVLEFPQSGERFDGVATSGSGGGSTRRPRSSSTSAGCAARGTSGSWRCGVRYDGGPRKYGVQILEFRGDKVGPRDDLRDGRLRGAGMALTVVGRAAAPARPATP